MTAIENIKKDETTKLCTLFRTISLELPRDNDMLASRHESGVKFNTASFTSIQGMAGIDEVVYILGTASTEYPKHIVQNVIMTCSKDRVSTVNAHHKNYGIWSISSKGMQFIVTVGADIERNNEIGSQLNTTIMIWDPEELLEKRSTRKEYDEEAKGSVYKPRVVSVGRRINLEQVSSVHVESELRVIALGLTNGAILIIKAGDTKLPNLYFCAENKYEYFHLQPEPGLELPITNIYVEVHNNIDRIDSVYCTCEKGFYNRTFGKKVKNELKYVKYGFNIGRNAMGYTNGDIIIFDSKATKIMKFRQGNMVTISKPLGKGVS